MRALLAVAALLLTVNASAQIRMIPARTGGSASAPAPNGTQAATLTAQNNPQCVGGVISGVTYPGILPFYIEMGDATAARFSLSVGTPTVSSTTRYVIASASKMIYAMYVVQKRGGYANLTASDIQFLTFQSGYTNMGSDTQGTQCTAPSSGNNSINYCLTLPGLVDPSHNGTYYNSATVNTFNYDSGHEQNHAAQNFSTLSAADTSVIGGTFAAAFGLSYGSGPGQFFLYYNQPLMAGGAYTSGHDYGTLLRAVLSGTVNFLGALGQNQVCAYTTTHTPPCNASFSPVAPQQWNYSIGHWVEIDSRYNNDGSFSSPGAFGFYPWIDSTKTYYGVISRYAKANGATGNGQRSQQCAQLVRRAWLTGVQQTGALPQ